jgi:lysophospholipid acyltransferase (LPLAT)-like uncharacterized protein
VSERGAFRAGWVLGKLLRGYRWLLRWEVREHAPLPRPCILAVWHGRLLGVLLHRTGSGMVTMASLSNDGALAAGAVEALGCRAVRGSASKGGSQALRQLRRALQEGAPLAGLTVDGPRGPFRQVKGGIVVAARWLGVPIVPASFSATRARVLSSWDRMVVPKPGARVLVGYGPPLAPEALPEELEAACGAVGEAIDALTWQLDQAVRGKSFWPELAP